MIVLNPTAVPKCADILVCIGHRDGQKTFNWDTFTVRKTINTFYPEIENKFKLRRYATNIVYTPKGIRVRSVTGFKNTRKLEDKPYARNLGCMSAPLLFAAAPNCHTSLYAAYCKRLSPVAPPANTKMLYGPFRSFVRRYLREHFRPIDNLSDRAMLDEWLEHSSYTQARKTKLAQVFETYSSCPLEERDFERGEFIKREFYPEPKLPRFIASASDRLLVRFGGPIHQVEKQVYRVPSFIKGISPSSLPPIMAERLGNYPVFMETDFTSFESCFSPAFTDCCECELWRYMFSSHPSLLTEMLRCYHTVKNGVIYPRAQHLKNPYFNATVAGTRMSGDLWTSLANGFSNLMMLSYLAERAGVKAEFFVEGDDGLTGASEKFCAEKDFAEFGFIIKLEWHSSIDKTEFCGNIFDLNEKLCLVEPNQACKLFWTTTTKYLHCGERVQNELLRSKAMSLYCTGKHSPIIGVLAWKTLQLIGTDGKVRVDPTEAWYFKQCIEQSDWSFPVTTQRSRLLYSQKFNISVQMQLDIESKILAATRVCDLLDNSLGLRSFDDHKVFL